MSSSLAPVEKKSMSVIEHLDSPRTIARFRHLVPQHMTPDRMLYLCKLALGNPKFLKSDPVALLGSFLALASLGLEPNTPLGHAYLIPYEIYENKKGTGRYRVELIIGYKGLVSLAKRSGNVLDIHADVVYEGDQFSFAYGSNRHLTHVPQWQTEKPVCAYSFAQLAVKDSFEVLPYSEILKTRNRSAGWQAYVKWQKETPWLNHERPMAIKTMIRYHAKTLDTSPELARAIAIDAKSEVGRLNTAVFAETDDAIENPELATIEPEPEEPTSLQDRLEKK